MTAQELLKELENCKGPCERLCIYCPEENNLGEIYETVEKLVKENRKLNEEAIYLTRLVEKLRAKLKDSAVDLCSCADNAYTYRRREPDED